MLHQSNKRVSTAFDQQMRLIDNSDRTGVSLATVLADAGLNYNDLVYKNSHTKQYHGENPYRLEDFSVLSKDVPVVSFFSGCGGMDLGLEAAGFNHIACFEINELFCKTIRRNRPTWKVFGPPIHSGDVSNFDEVSSTLEKLITIPFPGLFVGGPPCQPFSIAANQRFSKDGDNFKRVGFAHEKNGNLFFDFLRLIIKFKPRAFLVENVPGLRDLDSGEQVREAISQLSDNGYIVEDPFILDASRYGLPQQRIRLFITGTRVKNSFTFPEPAKNIVGCGSILCGDSSSLLGLHNSEIRMHNASSIMRYAQLDYGQRDHLGRVDRLDPMQPSKTVIAGGMSGGGRSHLHPEIPRTLSVRESARLQTFPDDFIFLGPTARQFTQVGNAVPPVLAAQIGLCVMKSFFK